MRSRMSRHLDTLLRFEPAAAELRALAPKARGVKPLVRSAPVLPPEFWITGAPRPEPWTPADSLGWVKMMAWDLGGNWRTELLRLQPGRYGRRFRVS